MRLDRRTFLRMAGLAAVARPTPPAAPGTETAAGVWVNDVHSQLTRTRVHEVVAPRSAEDVVAAIERAARAGRAVSICGSRHAMGAQPFGTDTVLLDLRTLNKVRRLDAEAGLVEVEAGVEWPELIAHLVDAQRDRKDAWGIVQKQTGADRLTIGGALAANAHGRGLTLKPLVGDVLAFTLVDARGRELRCDREQHAELFRLAIGGYGLFGVVTSVALRLSPRRKIERVVEMRTTEDLIERVEKRVQDGFLYGDFQFAIDPDSADFLRAGVFSCYRPVDPRTPIRESQKELADDDWRRLLKLAHTDRGRAFKEYSGYYLATSGQIYWSDTHQLSFYEADYHAVLDRAMGAPEPGTEMITEVYVPRPRLEDFLAEMRPTFRKNGVGIVYGTIRFIEKDDETFLPWARERYACMVVNLHVPHTDKGKVRTGGAFRDLIDMAQGRGGSYYLTYHRHARRDQVLRSYPQFPDFLKAKRQHDPEERFQSDWYRHHREMFA